MEPVHFLLWKKTAPAPPPPKKKVEPELMSVELFTRFFVFFCVVKKTVRLLRLSIAEQALETARMLVKYLEEKKKRELKKLF
jgi:hypothetical protein